VRGANEVMGGPSGCPFPTDARIRGLERSGYGRDPCMRALGPPADPDRQGPARQASRSCWQTLRSWCTTQTS
jgi:hypothetical protein